MTTISPMNRQLSQFTDTGTRKRQDSKQNLSELLTEEERHFFKQMEIYEKRGLPKHKQPFIVNLRV